MDKKFLYTGTYPKYRFALPSQPCVTFTLEPGIYKIISIRPEDYFTIKFLFNNGVKITDPTQEDYDNLDKQVTVVEEPEPILTEEELMKKTKNDLLKMCMDKALMVDNKMTKKELCKALLA